MFRYSSFRLLLHALVLPYPYLCYQTPFSFHLTFHIFLLSSLYVRKGRRKNVIRHKWKEEGQSFKTIARGGKHNRHEVLYNIRLVNIYYSYVYHFIEQLINEESEYMFFFFFLGKTLKFCYKRY